MISTRIARASALFHLVGGVVLLFAADMVLPRLIPGFPSDGAWLGQLLAAAWLGLGAANWLGQRTLLGGIYGRPLVVANAAHGFIGAMVVGKIAVGGAAPAAVWLLAAPLALLAAVYGWLLLRGPFERDLSARQRTP